MMTRPAPVVTLRGKRMVRVACGLSFVIATDSNGRVFSFGQGPLGHGDGVSRTTARLVRSLEHVVVTDVCAASQCAFAVTREGACCACPAPTTAT